LSGPVNDLTDEHREHLKSRAPTRALCRCGRPRPTAGRPIHDRADAVQPRIDAPPDTPHIADVVLRARRRWSTARTSVRPWRVRLNGPPCCGVCTSVWTPS